MTAALWVVALALIANVAIMLKVGTPQQNTYTGFFSRIGLFEKNFREVSKDEVQSYWDRKPCNSGWEFGATAPFGSKAFFEEVEKRKYKVEYHIPEFAEFDKWKGKRVLEVGGGICTTALSFAKAGANISVIDLSPKSMEVCRSRFHAYNIDPSMYQLYVGDAEHLSQTVPVEKFDLIWSFGVIHHSPYPEKSVAEMTKYMTDDTILKLMLYSKVSFKLFWIMNHTQHWDLSMMDEIVAHYSEAVEGSPVTYTYSYSEANKLVQEAGLQVHHMEKAHIFPYEIGAYKRNEYVREDIWTGVSEHRFLDLERELGWHLLITAGRKPPPPSPHFQLHSYSGTCRDPPQQQQQATRDL